MRVAVVTESFLPQVNGVTGSVLRVCEQMARLGHEAVVVAPGRGPTAYGAARVLRTPSVPLPGYGAFRLSLPWPGLERTLADLRPDVVHLASPAVLGAHAAVVARRLALPLVAVYQTDLAGFAARYGLRHAETAVWGWLRWLHSQAGRTLAPSRHAVDELRAHGVHRVAHWARGVDLERFSPAHRDEDLRRRLAPDGELLVGYVGRLAHEKQVHLLGALRDVPGVRVVVVGDGPQRGALHAALPQAAFLGFQQGAALSRAFASLDVFVHTGAHETFCQAAQEGLASGLPVVAPAAGGLLDLVEPGRTGALFVPGSGADLRAQVLAVTADPAERQQMGLRARASVLGRGWDVLGDQLLGHYLEVAS